MPADSKCVGFLFLCKQFSDKLICLFEANCKAEIVLLPLGDISQCVLRCIQLLVFEAVYTGIPEICEQCRRILFHERPQAEPFSCYCCSHDLILLAVQNYPSIILHKRINCMSRTKWAMKRTIRQLNRHVCLVRFIYCFVRFNR